MESRRGSPDGPLIFFPTLGPAWGACYTVCQFSPPHEFNVNVPKTLAIAHAESYAAYAWPQAFSGSFAHNVLEISIVQPLCVAAFFFLFPALNDRQLVLAMLGDPDAFLPLTL